jgi:hypothetical protein
MLLLALACATRTSPPIATVPVEDSPVEAPPPPFTADAIRDGMPSGTRLHFALDTPEGSAHVRWEVREHTAETGTFAFLPVDASDRPRGDDASSRSFAWTELEAHAHFPPGTTRVRHTHTVAGHALDGWRYTVPSDEGLQVFDFADALPGPPVQSPGMTLLADSRL